VREEINLPKLSRKEGVFVEEFGKREPRSEQLQTTLRTPFVISRLGKGAGELKK